MDPTLILMNQSLMGYFNESAPDFFINLSTGAGYFSRPFTGFVIAAGMNELLAEIAVFGVLILACLVYMIVHARMKEKE